MGSRKQYGAPTPILDDKELKLLDNLKQRYEKKISPGFIQKNIKLLSEKASSLIPLQTKDKISDIGEHITEAELYKEALNVVAKGFQVIELQASKITVSKKSIVESIKRRDATIETFEDICFARGYVISDIAWKNTAKNLGLALAEGAATGAIGVLGLPFNMVLSIFLYYRAVQSIAMYYGYDTKDNPEELTIASKVLMEALCPTLDKSTKTLSGVLGKMMLITESTVLKDSLIRKTTFEQMAKNGGVELLYVQIRALAHKSAQKALQNAGEKQIEKSIFSDMLKQFGKLMGKEATAKAVPVIGGIIGGLFDVAYMNKILEFANIVYQKRFLVEKETRIEELLLTDNNVM